MAVLATEAVAEQRMGCFDLQYFANPAYALAAAGCIVVAALATEVVEQRMG